MSVQLGCKKVDLEVLCDVTQSQFVNEIYQKVFFLNMD